MVILILSGIFMISVACADEDYMTDSGEIRQVVDGEVMTDSGEMEDVGSDGDYMTDSGETRNVSDYGDSPSSDQEGIPGLDQNGNIIADEANEE